MANIIDIPHLNPVKFVPVQGGPQGYINFDYNLFKELIKPWEHKKNYAQKQHVSKPIRIQLTTTFTPMQILVIDCHGNTIASYGGTVVSNPAVLPGFIMYEFNIIPPDIWGNYYLVLNVGEYDPDPEVSTLVPFISGPHNTIQSLDDMLVFDYKNERNDHDVVFNTGISFTYICEGGILRPEFKRRSTTFEDQQMSLKLIRSKSYREWPLVIGGSAGVPPEVADKVSRIFDCDNTVINGIRYTLPSDSEFEINELEYLPMYGYRTIIREWRNNMGIRAEGGGIPSDRFFVVFNIESKAFGTFNGNAGENLIQITKVD